MPEWVRWVLAALATYRLSVLFTIDDGPWDCFRKWRTRMGAYELGADGKPESDTGRLAACPYCIGMYMAALCAILVFAQGWVADAILAWLGLAGIQAVLQGRRESE